MTFAMPDMGSQGIFCTANLLNYLSVTGIKISMKPKEQMDSQIKPLKNYSRWYILQNFNSIKLASSVGAIATNLLKEGSFSGSKWES